MKSSVSFFIRLPIALLLLAPLAGMAQGIRVPGDVYGLDPSIPVFSLPAVNNDSLQQEDLTADPDRPKRFAKLLTVDVDLKEEKRGHV